ncbi:MAG TPA: pitrilysin family protein [Urbifossiella sp.]|nr:pitrilysin family protein [Urbifossiella sp.]
MSRVLFAVVALSLVCSRGMSAEPASRAQADADLARTAQGMFADLKTTTLDNGLRVYLLPVKNAPTVTTMVAYRVGSADEEKDQTGLSHYLEHLMFKGTDKLMPGDVDRATQRNGGRNNAYTSEDMTVYHFDFAADRWQSALAIEADRMRNIRIDAKHEFEQEKGNVISELERNEDGPWDVEQKRLLTRLFPKDSPYSHPVIGEREHVRNATAEIIKRHYDKWYYPNNAALVIVGGFDADAALEQVKKLFGPIAAGDLPKRKPPTFFKERQGPDRIEYASKFAVPRVVLGFNTIPVGDPDDPVLDVISNLLTDGRTSRLYRKLVEDERIASNVFAYNATGRYPGWFGVFAELLPGKDRAKAEAMLFAELGKLGNEPVAAAEFERARRKILAGFVFSRESVHSLADSIARASTYPHGQDVAKFYRDYLARLAALTPADVQRVAKKYLVKGSSAVVWSVPKAGKAGARGAASAAPAQRSAPPQRQLRSGGASRKADAPARSFSLTGAKRVVLPNGLVLVMLEDHRLPVVVGNLAIRDARLYEPADKLGIATFVGGLLEEGTTQHSGQEIAALIEDTGGTMSASASGGSLHVLTPDTDLGLGLMFECLIRPSFPADALERQRDQQISAIEETATQPHPRGSQLFKSLIYGDHPLGRPSLGKKEIVARLTAADCRAYQQSVIAPNHAILVMVGDFSADAMAKRIEGLTKDWKPSQLAKPKPPAPAHGTVLVERIVSDPAAAQVHIFLGHLGITRNNPDYYKLLVMDNVLGTGPGFTDRLSANLRDRQGLAYTVTATIASGAGVEPGLFSGYINPAAKNFLQARDGFVGEIARMCEAAPTAREVDDAKKYLVGSLPFKFTTMSDVAGQLLAAERYGLGFDFLEKYRKEIEAVTPEEVFAVAKKYLRPKALTIVAVGPIDKDGKPLK